MTSAPIASRAHKDMVKGNCACRRASQSVSHERRFYENLGSNPRRLQLGAAHCALRAAPSLQHVFTRCLD